MSKDDAERLAERIDNDSLLRPEMQRIGNGEWVVWLKYGPERFLFWGLSDWLKYKGMWSKYLYSLSA